MNRHALGAVFIDWYQTLSKSVFWEHLAEVNTNQYAVLQRSLFVNLRQHHEPWMRGARTTEQMMRLVASDTNLSYATIFTEFVASCQTMKFIAHEVPHLVKELRQRGVHVVIATDNMDSFSRFTVPAMGLSEVFDTVLNSFDLKALKEDFDAGRGNLFFPDYLVAQGLEPEKCILIDDCKSTLDAAERIGMGGRLVTAESTLVHHLVDLLQLLR